MATDKLGRYPYTEYQQDCEFLCGLLHQYEIEFVHLNPNSILQIVAFLHLYEAFLAVPPNLSLFKSYFLLKYQPNANNWKVIGGVGLQMHPRIGILDLPMKTSRKGWHKPWFYCENPDYHIIAFIGTVIPNSKRVKPKPPYVCQMFKSHV
jgi:hypothetical protein